MLHEKGHLTGELREQRVAILTFPSLKLYYMAFGVGMYDLFTGKSNRVSRNHQTLLSNKKDETY